MTHVVGSSGFTEYSSVSCKVKRLLRLTWTKTHVHTVCAVPAVSNYCCADRPTFFAEMVSVLVGRSHTDCSFTLITGLEPIICGHNSLNPYCSHCSTTGHSVDRVVIQWTDFT